MRAAILPAAVLAFLLLPAACTSKEKAEKQKAQQQYVYGDWQIVANSPDLTDPDSLLFLINPSGSTRDSTYYNGLYSSQYVNNDSLRVSVVYDTVAGFRLHIKRMVAVSVNPPQLNMAARCDSDSTMVMLTATQLPRQESIYLVNERPRMDSLMRSGRRVLFSAITPGGAANPDAQTYTFSIDTRGFVKARDMSDRYNHDRPAALKANRAPNIAEDIFGVW